MGHVFETLTTSSSKNIFSLADEAAMAEAFLLQVRVDVEVELGGKDEGELAMDKVLPLC